MNASKSAPLNRLIAPGWNAVKYNWKPFVLIQAAGVAFVIAYYTSAGLREATLGLQNLKTQGGLLFAMVTTALSSAVLPEIAKRLTLPNEPRPTAKDWAFLLTFFCVIGIEVDTLYRSLGGLLGTEVTPRVVLTKVLFDQLLFSTLISIPQSSVSFCWRDMDYKWSRVREKLRNGGFAKLYWPMMVMCWAFWVPVLACVYSMPKDMQFILFICANAAWSLLLVSIGTSKKS